MISDDTRGDDTRLEVAHRKLADAYLTVVPRDRAADVARRAMTALAEGAPVRTTNHGRLLAAMGGLLSLAAAAALVLAVAGRDHGAPVGRGFQPAGMVDSMASSIAVDVPEGRNAIVFTTRNPLISVVWIY